ncbi:Asp23/Gls24 family envelope stress response protein [Pseudonocardia nigra]|uniref:Asp23/Gls24 family envelope stress response protein n=1 Tax=Pseudonocardia nigra TaxID=1921578 RepID=UPI001C5DFBA1|nr:Asp23/Gls24 family envelope stress response protein [Pseudonocardia nigra]
MITGWAPEHVVTQVRAADVAARAARAVPGVVRLQPGVWGLVRQLAAEAFEQATGQQLPDIAGVQADLDDDGVHLELQIVVDGGYRAGTVGAAVQHAVTAAVPAAIDRAVTAFTVLIVEIELP